MKCIDILDFQTATAKNRYFRYFQYRNICAIKANSGNHRYYKFKKNESNIRSYILHANMAARKPLPDSASRKPLPPALENPCQKSMQLFIVIFVIKNERKTLYMQLLRGTFTTDRPLPNPTVHKLPSVTSNHKLSSPNQTDNLKLYS